jgi:hypothetical protein
MIEGGRKPRLVFESGQTIGSCRDLFGQDLDGHITPELRIACAINLSHPAGSDGP